MFDNLTFVTNRENKTSACSRKIQKLYNFSNNNSIIDQHRPYTTSLGRTQNLYAYRNINNVQEELNQTCGQEMSNYVAQKIKTFTRKHNQTLPLDETINTNLTILSNQNSIISKSQPKNIRQMRICGLSHPNPCRVQKVLGQPYFVNAREKLARMLARKRQNQFLYQTLQIKVKQKQKQKMVIKRKKDIEFRNPESISKSQWDNQWRLDHSKQVVRYRTRLSVKHKRKSSLFTIHF